MDRSDPAGSSDADLARVEQSVSHLTEEVRGLCADARREHDLLLGARQHMDSLRQDVDTLRRKIFAVEKDLRPAPERIAADARAAEGHDAEHARLRDHVAEVARARGGVVRFLGWAAMGVLAFGAGLAGDAVKKWLGIGGP